MTHLNILDASVCGGLAIGQQHERRNFITPRKFSKSGSQSRPARPPDFHPAAEKSRQAE
jgi:hypothetical protein